MPILHFYISSILNLPLHTQHHFQVGILPQPSRPFLEVHRNFRPLPVIVPCIPNPEFLLIYKSSNIFIHIISDCNTEFNTNKSMLHYKYKPFSTSTRLSYDSVSNSTVICRSTWKVLANSKPNRTLYSS